MPLRFASLLPFGTARLACGSAQVLVQGLAAVPARLTPYPSLTQLLARPSFRCYTLSRPGKARPYQLPDISEKENPIRHYHSDQIDHRSRNKEA